METQQVRIDGITWNIYPDGRIEPLCPIHYLRLTCDFPDSYRSSHLSCAECANSYSLPRTVFKEMQYVRDKIDSKKFKQMKFVNLDDEAVPLAEQKVSSKNGKYFVTALLTESKIGLRLIVYAGEKGRDEKTQIFVEPNIKRLAFDQKDLHPSDVFVEVEATFADGTKTSISKKGKQKESK